MPYLGTEGWFHNASAIRNILRENEMMGNLVKASQNSFWCVTDNCGYCANSTLQRAMQENLTNEELLRNYMEMGSGETIKS